jgi:2-(1,2-epoxy-1,2-dihydrophenyl)acetyl-CoA isomerase
VDGGVSESSASEGALVSVGRPADGVAVVEMHRPPHNFLDVPLVAAIADAYERLDDDLRVIVLCSEGKNFCAGADFHAASSARPLTAGAGTGALYDQAVRLFAARSPVVAAVQGAAVGGGFGLALSADFRVAGPGSRFVANFARLGLHQGFGMTVTLPAVVGNQRAMELLYTGRAVGGEEAAGLGLCDRLVEDDHIRSAAVEFAAELAGSAPLALRSIRATMRGDLAERIRAATAHEHAEQRRLRVTADHREGLAAVAERRDPRFSGR